MEPTAESALSHGKLQGAKGTALRVCLEYAHTSDHLADYSTSKDALDLLSPENLSSFGLPAFHRIYATAPLPMLNIHGVGSVGLPLTNLQTNVLQQERRCGGSPSMAGEAITKCLRYDAQEVNETTSTERMYVDIRAAVRYGQPCMGGFPGRSRAGSLRGPCHRLRRERSLSHGSKPLNRGSTLVSPVSFRLSRASSALTEDRVESLNSEYATSNATSR